MIAISISTCDCARTVLLMLAGRIFAGPDIFTAISLVSVADSLCIVRLTFVQRPSAIFVGWRTQSTWLCRDDIFTPAFCNTYSINPESTLSHKFSVEGPRFTNTKT